MGWGLGAGFKGGPDGGKFSRVKVKESEGETLGVLFSRSLFISPVIFMHLHSPSIFLLLFYSALYTCFLIYLIDLFITLIAFQHTSFFSKFR